MWSTFILREGKVRMEQMNLLHPSAPANPGSLAKRDARGCFFAPAELKIVKI